MEELIKKIQTAVQNNGNSLTIYEIGLNERPCIEWDGFNVCFLLEGLSPSSVDGHIGVSGYTVCLSQKNIPYEKIPQNILQQISDAIDKFELIKRISELVVQKNNSNIASLTWVYLKEPFLINENQIEFSINSLEVDSVFVSKYDMSRETPEFIFYHYSFFDYATLEEICMRLEEI